MKDAPYRNKAMQYLIDCIADDDPGTIPDDIKWPEVIALAKFHKVIPLLYQNVKDKLPDTERETLRKTFFAIATRNTFIAEELVRILDLLNKHDITAIPFKGPILALQAYDDLSMRQFDDIDLIIPDKHILRAIKILKELDYKPDINFSKSAAKGYIRAGQDWTLHSSNSDICLDIRSSIASKAALSSKALAGMINRQDTVSYKSADFPCLTLEDAIEAICVHATHHGWERLSWIIDVAWMAQKMGEEGMNAAITNARKNGTIRRVLLGLDLANAVLKAETPKTIIGLIDADESIKGLTEASINNLHKHPSGPGALSYWWFQLRSTEKIGDKLRELIYYVFTPSKVEFNMIALPTYAYPLYYIIRPLRLIYSSITRQSPA